MVITTTRKLLVTYSWMRRYFDYNHDIVMNTARKVFAQNRRGFLVACDLLIKVIPDLSEGIQLVGVFSKIPNEVKSVMLVDSNNGEILGLTQEIYENYGIHPALSYGNSQSASIVSILQIFPSIQTIENLRAKFISSHEMVLDTTPLATLTLAARTEFGDFGVPPPKGFLFRSYSVRTNPSEAYNHGTKGLNIFELAIMDAFARVRRKSHGHAAMIDPGAEEIIEEMKNNIWNHKSDKIESSEDSGLDEHLLHMSNSYTTPKSINKNNLDDVDLTEEELERLKLKAEKERKLKEHKQMLKRKETPFQITLLYTIMGLCLFLTAVGHSVQLILKLYNHSNVEKNMKSVYSLSSRAALIPIITFQTTKLMDSSL